MAFLVKILLLVLQILDLKISSIEKRQFYRRKLAEIADLNIDPKVV
jgi:hypothetical protein